MMAEFLNGTKGLAFRPRQVCPTTKCLGFSLLFVFVLSSCSVAQKQIEVNIENSASGCFSITEIKTDISHPVLLKAKVLPNSIGDCPCKSALLKYVVVQEIDGYENFLMSGTFSPLDTASLSLPLSVQAKLIVQEKPVSVEITCASN